MIPTDKDIIIGFPHGLGDFICLTPALRELRRQLPSEFSISLVALPKMIKSGIARSCPHLKKIYTLDYDIWTEENASKNGNPLGIDRSKISECLKINMKIWMLHVNKLAMIFNATPFFITFNDPTFSKHKIDLALSEMGLVSEDLKTEVYIDQDANDKFRSRRLLSFDYAFVHLESSDNKRRIESSEMRKNLPEDIHIYETGGHSDINVEFKILSEASKVILTNSVFMHAANAMNKNIDILYLGKNSNISWERHKPRDIKIEKIIR